MARSYLYAPGDRPDRLDRALATGADAVIGDLEDGVAPSAKDAARANIASWLAADPSGVVRLVRVNAGELLAADTAVLAPCPPDGVVLPKATFDAVEHLDGVLGTWDHDRAVAVTALVESSAGVLDLEALAAHPRVQAVALGEADLVADLGLDPSPDHRELWPLRMRVVVAAAAAGIDPPVGPVATDFRDLDRLVDTTEALRRAGYGARSAVHPDQVAIINDVFTPGAEEVAAAAGVVARFDEAVAAGRGVAVDDEGHMIDEAVVRRARHTLSASAEAERRDR